MGATVERSIAFVFTDIEGSTRLWEQAPARMRGALARHDALARTAVTGSRGTLVKTTGDGIYAAFEDPLDAVRASVALQLALADPAATDGVALKVRCGVHLGVVECRDADYFGSAVNRAARIMAAAHGGQTLLSEAVANAVRGRLDAALALDDLGRVRLRDLAQPERVYQVVHPRLRREFPALRSLEATPNNLPQQITRFVGREAELAEAGRLLATARLVTLQGVGGLGKTRLALQVAAESLDAFPDGVWFVELASLSDPALVPQSAARALSLHEDAARAVAETLAAHVADRRLLLVLDNCEHLAEACAQFARAMLEAGPQVKVLATSREPLRVAGEVAYALPTLSTPAPGTPRTLAALAQCDAVRLFVERASAARPAFRLSEENAAAVAEICRRLDGIPLAIELAAARVRGLPVAAIAGRLSDRFRLLSGGDATALPRQQTLRACIDWSHDLLGVPERTLFRRLCAFAGGFTLAAVEAVCAGGDLDRADVVDLLTQLVDRSLVEFGAETARYRLLETVREYAHERLSDAAEAAHLRRRHFDFYLAFAEEATPHLQGADQGSWLARLDVERENILAAHSHCDHADLGTELGLRLVVAMLHACTLRGDLELGRHVAIEALARGTGTECSVDRMRVALALSQMCYLMGRYDDARSYCEPLLPIAEARGDVRRAAIAHRLLGLIEVACGARADARPHLERAYALALEIDASHAICAAANSLADFHRVGGDLDRAEPLYADVLRFGERGGDKAAVVAAKLNLAMVAIARGDLRTAAHRLDEGLAANEDARSHHAALIGLEAAAAFAALRGEWALAARMAGAAEGAMAARGYRFEPPDEALFTRLLATAKAGIGEAAYAAQAAAGREAQVDEVLAEARSWLGAVVAGPLDS